MQIVGCGFERFGTNGGGAGGEGGLAGGAGGDCGCGSSGGGEVGVGGGGESAPQSGMVPQPASKTSLFLPLINRFPSSGMMSM